MNFGEFILHRRNVLHFSAAELAARAGFAESYISTIERGHQKPTKDSTIQKLASALQVANWEWLKAYAVFDKDPRLIFGETKDIDPDVNALMRRLLELSDDQRKAATQACEGVLDAYERAAMLETQKRIPDKTALRLQQLIEAGDVDGLKREIANLDPSVAKKIDEDILGNYLHHGLKSLPSIGGLSAGLMF